MAQTIHQARGQEFWADRLKHCVKKPFYYDIMCIWGNPHMGWATTDAHKRCPRNPSGENPAEIEMEQ